MSDNSDVSVTNKESGMSEQTQSKKKRSRKRQVYVYHKNAVCVSVYDPSGGTIPQEARREVEDSILETALKHRLLINIAYE
jgi:hypothetical protein